MLKEAMEIYSQIMEPVNEYVMNTMLSLMLHSKQSDQVTKLWQEMPRVVTESSNPQITFSLILKCIACSKKDVEPLMAPLFDTLMWIKDHPQHLVMSKEEYSTLICRVIRRFSVNLYSLQEIHSL